MKRVQLRSPSALNALGIQRNEKPSFSNRWATLPPPLLLREDMREWLSLKL